MADRNRAEGSATSSRLLLLATIAFVVAVLYFAEAILLPFALAVLVSFLLSPLVTRFQRWRVGRVPAVVLAVGLAFTALGVAGWIATYQLIDLTGKLPQYRQNLTNKVRALQAVTSGRFSAAAGTLEEIGHELAEPAARGKGRQNGTAAPQTTGPAETPAPKPLPVTVVAPPMTPVRFLQEWLGSLLEPLATAGIVVIFAIFMLIEREDLRDRLMRLVGEERLHLTTQVLDEAANRTSRYLRMQLIINASFGGLVALGLFLLGLPNALLWGMLAAVFRYVPYIGAPVAAAMPILLSLAVFDGWARPLAVLGLFIVLELTIANFMEPYLYGSSTGMSALGILASAMFWTWLWGAVGLLLSTPLTVCLVVLARYVPGLGFLGTLLSDEPVLGPEVRLYQRLLATDQEEAHELIDDYLEDHSVDALYEEVLVPTLKLVEEARHAGYLKPENEEFIYRSLRELVGELSEDMASDAEAAAADLPDRRLRTIRILCLPARDEADELAAILFAQCLVKRGYTAEAASARSLASDLVGRVETERADLVVISVLPPLGSRYARYLCKRLHARFADLRIIVGLWTAQDLRDRAEERMRADGADKVARNFSEAHQQIEQMTSAILLARPVAEPDAEKPRPAEAGVAPLV